ncbi:MAG: efflux RND transporter periplasmic adaptor subunit [Gemmataceae bacterium]|nr:efflux RND transporter periplasmic adaptor subunit [Gemmataceae bacterium]
MSQRPTTNPDRPRTSHDISASPSGLAAFLSLIPTALTVLAFAALAFWGFRTEWKFTNPFAAQAEEAGKKKLEEVDSDVVPPPKESLNAACPLDRTRVRLKAPDIASLMGLKTVPAQMQPLQATVTAPAELSYDETRLAKLSSRVPGTVVRVEKEVGNLVREGEVVALIDAAEVGKAKAGLLQALAQQDLQEQTLKSLQEAGGAVPKQKVKEAEAAARAARVSLQANRQALVNLGLPVDLAKLRKLPPGKQDDLLRLAGLPDDYARSLEADTVSSNLIPVVAPFAGVVVERRVVVGEVVDSTKAIFQVGDLGRMWVIADIRTEDADRVAVGQRLAFESDGHKGEAIEGKVSWISTAVDNRTRTLRVRAVVENPKAHWRANTFGTARVRLRDEKAPVLAVPADALQRDGDCWYVFVRADPTTFEMRSVRLGVRGTAGPRKEAWVEVRGGLEAGQHVATAGAFALKSEVLKDKLGGDAD